MPGPGEVSTRFYKVPWTHIEDWSFLKGLFWCLHPSGLE